MKRIITLLIGIACVVTGIVILVSHFNAKKVQTAETTATIVRVDSELETDSDGLETRMYYPVVKYQVNEKEYEKRLSNAGTSDSTTYKEGETVEITYNPENPEEFSQKGNNGGLIGGIFFIVIGIIVAFATFVGKMF